MNISKVCQEGDLPKPEDFLSGALSLKEEKLEKEIKEVDDLMKNSVSC